MQDSVLSAGFRPFAAHDSDHGDQECADHHHHCHHAHGVIDPEITSSQRGLWAVQMSFLVLLGIAVVQAGVFWISGSVALLADLIHNLGDALTALPLGVAFFVSHWRPSRRFSYGYGKGEDLAGLGIVAMVLFSALLTGYESLERFMHPHTPDHLGALAAAAVVGCIGNGWVAAFRIRIGKQIGSAALVADGHHARADGLISLSVVLSALGSGCGYGWADPVIGVGITLGLLHIVWESGQVLLERILDGVDPELTEEIRQAAQCQGVRRIERVRARWMGHKLMAEVEIGVDPQLTVMEIQQICHQIRAQLQREIPYLAEAMVQVEAEVS